MGLKTLVIVSDDQSRRDTSERIVREAVRKAVVTKLDRGISIGSDKIADDILESNGYDLIIQHCGSTNGEYLSFIQAYKSLARENGWSEPAIILFSGSPAAVKEAEKAFLGDPYVCAITQDDLETNLKSFIEIEYGNLADAHGSDQEEMHWHILLGYGEAEYQLQVLSALLPFGVMWEAGGKVRSNAAFKDSVQSLRAQEFWGTESLIVERIGGLIATAPAAPDKWDSNKFDRGIVFINNLLAEKAAGSRLVKRLSKLKGVSQTDSSAAPLDMALRILSRSKTLNQWNWRLSQLRNHMLE